MPSLKELTQQFQEEEALIRQGGGVKGQQRQKRHGRMTVRERLEHLLDSQDSFFELGIWSAYKMYEEWGGLPAAGVVAGIGIVNGRECMIIANDATVKAGAMFPQAVKKMLRAQRIAYECRLPILYLVDSSGVFLPLQDEIFPDEDDFGRIFRNNAVISAAGIPQFAAIMGNCIAGGGYLPVLCDQLLMTEGSGLYLAGPALVKAAIGQDVDTEALGGAKMHAEISGTVDYLEPDDLHCITRLRKLVGMLPEDPVYEHAGEAKLGSETLYASGGVDQLLDAVVDQASFEEYKAGYGKSLVCGYARIGGMSVGIVANQRGQTINGRGEVEIGGVIYAESADKAARFIMDCNQLKVPIIFFQDVVGFMVGRAAEESGIIKSGAKLVNAVSNSIVPKITVVVGNSFGAGNYALCGKAYDPNFILAWPNAKYAVMGGAQATETLCKIEKREHDPEISKRYNEQMDIRYGAARGWIDAIIDPAKTRDHLIKLLKLVKRAPESVKRFHTGVMQV